MHGFREVGLSLVALAVAGCAAGAQPTVNMLGTIPLPPAEYRHTISTDAIRQYWNCTRPTPNMVRLNGVVANVWNSQPIRYLAWDMVGVDTAGRTLESTRVTAAVFELLTNTYTPFQIDLRVGGGEARFDLYYEYEFQHRGHHRPMFSALDWGGRAQARRSQFGPVNQSNSSRARSLVAAVTSCTQWTTIGRSLAGSYGESTSSSVTVRLTANTKAIIGPTKQASSISLMRALSGRVYGEYMAGRHQGLSIDLRRRIGIFPDFSARWTRDAAVRQV